VDGHEGSGHALPKLSTAVYLVLILSSTDNRLCPQSFLAMTVQHQLSLVAKTEYCMKISVVHASTGDF